MTALRTWFLHLPLARKLGWLMGAMVGLALVMCVGLVTIKEIHSIRDDARQRFHALASVVARECTAALAFDHAQDAHDSLSALSVDEDVWAAWVLKPDRSILAEFQRAAPSRPLPDALPNSPWIDWRGRRLVVERPVVLAGETVGRVVLECSMESYINRLAAYGGVMTLFLVLGLAATVVLSRWLLRQVTDPVQELAALAQQVSQDKNYTLRAVKRSPDELGQLVDAFNHMLQAVQARDAELEQARATLEQRVEERTAELQREVVERRQIEEELRRSEQRFAQVFRASPLPIILRGVDQSRILEVNQSFLDLLGYRREEVLGRTVEELGLNANAQQVAELSERAKKNGGLKNVEVHWRGKGGRAGTARLFAEKIEWVKEPCLLIILYDTTHQTKMEQQLRQAQKLEAVGQLAAGVAHDFNNILTIIQANASLGMNEPNLDPMLKDCLEQISQAAERAASLTRQLLAFSRRQTMQPAEVDLNQLVVDFARMLHRAVTERVKVQFNLTPEVPTIRADPAMVEQVLTNLALNARDAMPDGGTLTISTEEVELDEDFVRHHPRARAGRFVRLQVADTGVGISPELLPRIFEPFFTTKDVGKGTGLGLAAVYGTVDSHGGWVDVESEVGRGTTFSVFWPVYQGPAQTPAERGGRAEVRGGNEVIMLVEDEPAVRGIARHVLKKYGYVVVEAVSGRAALKLWPAIQEKVEMVVTDAVMPDGISGQQLAEELRRTKPTLPVLLVSGYNPELTGMSKSPLAGCRFLAKPFKPIELARLVREMLDEAQSGHASSGGDGHGGGTDRAHPLSGAAQQNAEARSD